MPSIFWIVPLSISIYHLISALPSSIILPLREYTSIAFSRVFPNSFFIACNIPSLSSATKAFASGNAEGSTTFMVQVAVAPVYSSFSVTVAVIVTVPTLLPAWTSPTEAEEFVVALTVKDSPTFTE